MHWMRSATIWGDRSARRETLRTLVRVEAALHVSRVHGTTIRCLPSTATIQQDVHSGVPCIVQKFARRPQMQAKGFYLVIMGKHVICIYDSHRTELEF